ncbi:MAG: hydrogen gas-evolving membrane-bound hydrogenase subunit E [Eubacteriales bacterium]
MSKLRDSSEYKKTKSYRFFTWLTGEKDPYLDCVEMKPQKDRTVPNEVVEAHKQERQVMREKMYDLDHNQLVQRLSKFYKVMCVVFCITLFVVLVITVSFLPPVGDASNPNHNEVATRYAEQTIEDTGATNAVTAMITQYRGFDTFGETHVLYISTICVMILLMVNDHKNVKFVEEYAQRFEPQNDRILQVNAFILAPMAFMFGFYIILNGHLSPGGGFAGGAIIGAGLILFASAYGFTRTQQFFGEKHYKVIKVTALVLYAIIMSVYFYTGANNISLNIPLGNPGSILSAGIILPINILVGLEVACTMYAFFALFRKGGL